MDPLFHQQKPSVIQPEVAQVASPIDSVQRFPITPETARLSRVGLALAGSLFSTVVIFAHIGFEVGQEQIRRISKR